jgi:hypothetical protein
MVKRQINKDVQSMALPVLGTNYMYPES